MSSIVVGSDTLAADCSDSDSLQDTMPVERMRMRPWLEEQINSCLIPGLKWVNKEKKIFQIPWMHAARHGWDLQKDAPLFMKWAIHTGKYQLGVDRPDPKTWKANFRCAVNSLPDMEEVKDKSIKKGTNAFRVYKMLSSSERSTKKGKKKKDGKPKAAKEGDFKAEDEGEEAMMGMDIKEEVCEEEDGRELDGNLGIHYPIGEHLITSEQLPFVCQTIEVTTENEEQMVSSSHSYPLQISPVSSYCDSDTDSLNSETEDAGECPCIGVNGGVHGIHASCCGERQRRRGFPQTGVSGAWMRNYSTSILRMPSGPLPGMSSFMANKPSLRITTIQDPNPLISYRADKWTTRYVKSKPGTTGHEVRASVIMKTSDVNSS
ncbi:interferon regulatory factor 2 isoform X2 [Gadus morhua]|uniref:interferon regulatory factor 2 isoform X2 n=1 Tax=Gadus morhua TaxID=8049 RepID=UPI0011B4B97A|nr:interferon regulatory factor 2 isoform X2 [Gadus morhua]